MVGGFLGPSPFCFTGRGDRRRVNHIIHQSVVPSVLITKTDGRTDRKPKTSLQKDEGAEGKGGLKATSAQFLTFRLSPPDHFFLFSSCIHSFSLEIWMFYSQNTFFFFTHYFTRHVVDVAVVVVVVGVVDVVVVVDVFVMVVDCPLTGQ